MKSEDVSNLYNSETIKKDLKNVKEWFPNQEIYFTIKKSVPIKNFEKDITEMISTYDEFPQDAKRTKKIRQLLTKGQPQLPIFVNAKFNFTIEGRHRMCAFYQLNIPTVDCIYVHAKENINEVTSASYLNDLNISDENIISNATFDGVADGLKIYRFEDGDRVLFFLHKNSKIEALALFENNHLKAVKNICGRPGYITTIIGYVVYNLSVDVIISDSEPLTDDGFRWLSKLINYPRSQKFTFKDQFGNPIDIETLKQDWENDAGKIAVIISKIDSLQERFNFNATAIISTTMWREDHDLL
jgi:hypothetical protein